MKTIDALTLTSKQQRFCDEYLIDMNATRAALRAGYTQATAVNGQLMELPKIQHYLKERTAQASQKLQIGHETVLAELAKVAFANMGDYFGDDGKIKAIGDIAEDKKSAIWSLKVSEGKYGTMVQLRLHNKLAAIEKIAKHIKFYEPEEKEQETEYVYLDKADLNEHDRFEDDSVDALDKADSERKARLDAFEMNLCKRDRELQKREEHLKGLGVLVGGNPEPDNSVVDEPSLERKLTWAETYAIIGGIACRNGEEMTAVLQKEKEKESQAAAAINAQASKPGDPLYGGGKKLSKELMKERRQQYRDNTPGWDSGRGLRNDVGRFFAGRKVLLR